MIINKLPGFGLRALAKAPPPRPGATYRLRSVPVGKVGSTDLANRRAKLRAALSRTTYTEVDDDEYTTFTVQEATP